MNIALKTDISSKIEFLNEIHKDVFLYECEERIDKNRVKGKVISVQAIADGIVIGLGIADFNEKNLESNILSIFVKPEFRGQRIGTQILKTLVANLEDRGFEKVNILYQSNWETFDFMKRHLAAHGWTGPEEIIKVFIVDISKRIDEVMELELPVAQILEIETWENQSKNRLEKLKKYLSENNDIPEHLNPFRDEDMIASECSMVAIDKDTIVGWNMSYKKGENSQEYSNLFIDKNFRSRGLVWSLFISSVKVQARLGINFLIGMVDIQNTEILDYCIRRISNNQFKSHSHFKFSKDLT